MLSLVELPTKEMRSQLVMGTQQVPISVGLFLLMLLLVDLNPSPHPSKAVLCLDRWHRLNSEAAFSFKILQSCLSPAVCPFLTHQASPEYSKACRHFLIRQTLNTFSPWLACHHQDPHLPLVPQPDQPVAEREEMGREERDGRGARGLMFLLRD